MIPTRQDEPRGIPEEAAFKASAWGVSEKGRRKENQDHIYPMPPSPMEEVSAKLFVVCDGVGGEAMGHEASRITCETVGAVLEDTAHCGKAHVLAAIRHAEEALDLFVKDHPQAEGMATTLALVMVKPGSALLAHVGDSRIYHIRDGAVLYRTTDHSFVQDMVDQGLITKEEARRHPHRSVISRAIVSAAKPVDPEMEVRDDVREGDLFFICTDGLLEGLTDGQLVRMLSDVTITDRKKMERLADHCRKHSRDNYTSWLVRIHTQGETVGKVKSRSWLFKKAFPRMKEQTGQLQAVVYLALVVVGINILVVMVDLFQRPASEGEKIHASPSSHDQALPGATPEQTLDTLKVHPSSPNGNTPN